MIYIWRIKGSATYTRKLKYFKNKKGHSRKFVAIIEWLKETTKLSDPAHKNKVTADLNIKLQQKRLK